MLACSFGNLAPQESVSVHVVATSPATNSILTSTAVAWGVNIPKTSSNQASIAVVYKSDLSIVKTAASATVVAGQPITFTVKIENIGSYTAKDVEMVDPLPVVQGVNWLIKNSDPGCEIANGTLICSFGSLNSGSTRSVTITSFTSTDSCGLINNTASVSASNEPGESQNNNIASASIEVLCPQPVLTVMKAAEVSLVKAGDAIRFHITVQNTGNGPAKNVVIEDALPAGLDWNWTVPDGATCTKNNLNTLSCNLYKLEAGKSTSIHITANSSENICATIDNQASAFSDNHGRVYSETVSITTIDCQQDADADVSVTKTASSESITPGEHVTFTMIVKNNSSLVTAKNVILSDRLQGGLSWSLVENVQGCDINIMNGTLTCNFGSLPGGESRSVAIFAPTTADNCGLTVNNTATVSSGSDPNAPAYKTSTSTVAVVCADVEVSKSAVSATVDAGQPIGFKIQVDNLSSSTAQSVELTDSLPAGFDWSIDGAVDGCAISSGTLTCSFGDLPSGSGSTRSVTVTARTTVASCSELERYTVSNTATVTSNDDPYDPANPANNKDSAEVVVVCPGPSLIVTKTADASPVTAGDMVGFSIKATNPGSEATTNVVINDQLPAGLKWSETTGATCTETKINETTTLSCRMGTLAAGESVTVHIAAQSSIPATCSTHTIANTAFATADNHSQVNSPEAAITINCPPPADVRITKVAVPSSINPGQAASFTMTVENTSTSVTARNVILTDTLPVVAGQSWSIMEQVGGCGINYIDGTLTCNFGSLPASTSRSVTITTPPITTNSCDQTVSNSASVSSGNDPNAGNNTSDATITVLCPGPRLVVTKRADDSSVPALGQIGYTITVVNIGTEDAGEVFLDDDLYSDLIWSETTQNIYCSIGPNTNTHTTQYLSCKFPSLAKNASNGISVHVTAQITPSVCGTITNTAYAEERTYGQVQSDSVTVTVACSQVDKNNITYSYYLPIISGSPNAGLYAPAANINDSWAQQLQLR
jgi:uncharacterized repeat protein (TIGR01451 family)